MSKINWGFIIALGLLFIIPPIGILLLIGMLIEWIIDSISDDTKETMEEKCRRFLKWVYGIEIKGGKNHGKEKTV